jgi:hypothetical protein
MEQSAPNENKHGREERQQTDKNKKDDRTAWLL